MRRRRSASCSSGTLTRNGRIAVSVAMSTVPVFMRVAVISFPPVPAISISVTTFRLCLATGIRQLTGFLTGHIGHRLGPSRIRLGDLGRNRPLTQRLEGGAQLLTEDLRLFPGGEVAAYVNLVPVDEIPEAALAPASRRRVDLGRKHGNGDREFRDVDCVERAAASPRSF